MLCESHDYKFFCYSSWTHIITTPVYYTDLMTMYTTPYSTISLVTWPIAVPNTSHILSTHPPPLLTPYHIPILYFPHSNLLPLSRHAYVYTRELIVKYINASSCFFVTKETDSTVLCCCSPNTQSNNDLKTSHKPVGWAKQSGKRLNHRLACEATNTILYEDDGNGPQTEKDCPHYQESQGT